MEQCLLALARPRSLRQRRAAGQWRHRTPRQRGAEALAEPSPGITLAIDAEKRLADEEMKVIFRPDGTLAKITKQIDPASAHGEYIGV
jgi:hypothetical protein